MSALDKFWFQSCENQKISSEIANSWLQTIQTKYNTESHRIYHNLNVLIKKFEFLKSLPASLNYSDYLIFAIVFQYYHFDLKCDCSEKNCTALREFCVAAHVDNAQFIDSVCYLLGDSSKTFSGNAQDIEIFQDLDLIVLGSPSNEYKEYQQATQKEYSHLDESTYKSTRLRLNQSSSSPTTGAKINGSLPRLAKPKKVNGKPTPKRLRPLEHPHLFPLNRKANNKTRKLKKKGRIIFVSNESRAASSTADSTLDDSQPVVIVLDAETDTRTIKQTPTKVQKPTENQSHSSDSESESESDCEIIENVTPLIVVDDDDLTEPTSPTSETEVNSTATTSEQTENTKNTDNTENSENTENTESIESIESTENQSSEKTFEPETVSATSEKETEQEPEPDPEPPVPLFFIDKNPGIECEAPIYEVIDCIEAKKTGAETMTSKTPNIQICGPVNFTNKENHTIVEPIFAPNPQLSSTRLNDSLDENANATLDNDSPTTEKNFQISIDSTCETGASRSVTVFRSPKPNQALTNIGNNNIIEHSRPNKRKPTKISTDEPPTKKTNASDVIVLNDTISDTEEDSVVFVSETIEKRDRNALIGRSNKHKALDYISLGNDSGNQQQPKSTRAKRRKEKKMMGKQPNGKSKKQQNQQQQNGGKNKRANRFDANNPSTSFDTYASVIAQGTSTVTSNSPESKRAAKRNLVIQYEKEKQLFADKPELFEKRMVIIDGSNVARTHGIRDNSYSIKGIEVCMKHFEDRGFKVKAVVPQMRQKRSQSTDPELLERMVNAGKIIVTPCKNLPGIRSTCYDDRFILNAAEEFDGVIISNDNYADLLEESPEWAEIIKERVVGFSFCDDFIMFPKDPYGRNGRPLQLILHKLKPDAVVDDKYLTK